MPHVHLLLVVVLALFGVPVRGEEGTTLQDAFERRPARLGLVPTNSPFAFVDEATGNVTGFDVALSAALCELANLECEVVTLREFQDRIPALQNDTVDFVVAMFSFTPDRDKQVDFVRPFYYSSGVGMFAPADNAAFLQETGGWEGLKERPVCLETGYYGNSAVIRQYGITPVYYEGHEDGIAKLLAGECEVLAADNVDVQYVDQGVELISAVSPVLPSPYGVAVQQGDGALAGRLSAAMVQLMQDGVNSPVLKWEEQFLLSAGLPPNVELGNLVQAITYLNPQTVS